MLVGSLYFNLHAYGFIMCDYNVWSIRSESCKIFIGGLSPEITGTYSSVSL
jgi:hypothetical protein